MDKVKRKHIQKLISEIRSDNSCRKINPPLVNQFALHKKIPNRWFDWENRVDSPIMIIGQDWGPYIHLKKYIDEPEKDHFASSRTEKFIINTLNAINPHLINTIFFTVAVIYTRTGTLFRGSQNYNENKSFEISFPYVSRQISIMKPKIIMPLGSLALQVLDRHFSLGLKGKKLTEIVKLRYIKVPGSIIIPAYHPAAFVGPEIQKTAWEYLGRVINENKYL